MNTLSRWTTAIMVLAVVGMLTATIPACQKSSTDASSSDQPRIAGAIKDGTEAYWVQQNQCPVCGGQPIKGDFHVDVSGRRVYMDKKECVQKFNSNQEKYKKQLQQQMKQQFMGGGGQ